MAPRIAAVTFASSLGLLCVIEAVSALRRVGSDPSTGADSLSVAIATTASAFWVGLGYWAASIPFSLSDPVPIQWLGWPVLAFVHPFLFTFVSIDVAGDLAAVLAISLPAGLLVAAGELLRRAV